MMKEKSHVPDSLLHDTNRDRRSVFSFIISILCHLLIAGGIILAPKYIPAYAPNPGFSPSSVINVSMVTLPAEEGGGDADKAEKTVPEKNMPEPKESEPVTSPEPKKAEETVPVVEPEKSETKIPEPEKLTEKIVVEPEKPKEKVVVEPKKIKEIKPKLEKPKIKPATVEKDPPKPAETKKYKAPDKRVVKARTSESDNKVSGAPRDAIERIRQSLKKTAGHGSGIGDGNQGTGSGSGGQGEGSSGGNGGFGSLLGRRDSDALRFYRENVIPDAINRNWAFSEHMTRRRFNLEAVLVIRIMPNGNISDVWFEKKSGDKYFDDSAYKAVIKSNPLPSLPGGSGPYKVGLRFTPSGMK